MRAERTTRLVAGQSLFVCALRAASGPVRWDRAARPLAPSLPLELPEYRSRAAAYARQDPRPGDAGRVLSAADRAEPGPKRVLSAAREGLRGRARPAETGRTRTAARGSKRRGPVDFPSVSVLSGSPARSASSAEARVLSTAPQHVLSAASGSNGRVQRPAAGVTIACTFTGTIPQPQWPPHFESKSNFGHARRGERERPLRAAISANGGGMYFQPHDAGTLGGTSMWDQPRRRVRTAASSAYVQRHARVGTAAGDRQFRQRNQKLGRRHVFMSHETCCMSRHGSGDDGEL